MMSQEEMEQIPSRSSISPEFETFDIRGYSLYSHRPMPTARHSASSLPTGFVNFDYSRHPHRSSASQPRSSFNTMDRQHQDYHYYNEAEDDDAPLLHPDAPSQRLPHAPRPRFFASHHSRAGREWRVAVNFLFILRCFVFVLSLILFCILLSSAEWWKDRSSHNGLRVFLAILAGSLVLWSLLQLLNPFFKLLVRLCGGTRKVHGVTEGYFCSIGALEFTWKGGPRGRLSPHWAHLARFVDLVMTVSSLILVLCVWSVRRVPWGARGGAKGVAIPTLIFQFAVMFLPWLSLPLKFKAHIIAVDDEDDFPSRRVVLSKEGRNTYHDASAIHRAVPAAAAGPVQDAVEANYTATTGDTREGSASEAATVVPRPPSVSMGYDDDEDQVTKASRMV